MFDEASPPPVGELVDLLRTYSAAQMDVGSRKIPMPPQGRLKYPKCFNEFHYPRNREVNVGKKCPDCGFEMTAEQV